MGAWVVAGGVAGALAAGAGILAVLVLGDAGGSWES